MKGKIFNLIRGSTEDGKGLRTVVYCSGCSLNCSWCQNPEGKTEKPLLYYAHKCVGCGECEKVCRRGCHRIVSGKHVFSRTKCIRCGDCAKSCPAGALAFVQSETEASELVRLIARDKDFFFSSGGGVTFSGGECVLQNDFLAEALRLCKEDGIDTAIETALFYDYSLLKRLLPYIDCVLADLKHTDSAKHKEFIGFGNEKILSNLKMLLKEETKTVVRCALIPGFNDDENSLKEMALFVRENGGREMELLNFNDTIENKYSACGQAVARKFGKAFSAEEFGKKKEFITKILS